MSPGALGKLAVLAAVLTAATACGVLLRRYSGRTRSQPADRPLDPGLLSGLGVHPGTVTLLQFSTAFCAPCRATRRILSQVAETVPGVRHVDVDAESHLSEVRRLGILRTPTTLIVDAGGRVRNRVVGQPRPADVRDALAPILGTAVSDSGKGGGSR